jgi:serine/threonine protein kinase
MAAHPGRLVALPSVAAATAFATRETSSFVADEEHVNDYEMVRELGRGTFASVYKVRDRRDGHIYVRGPCPPDEAENERGSEPPAAAPPPQRVRRPMRD